MPHETVLQCSRGPTKKDVDQRWGTTRFELHCLPAIHYVVLKFARILDAAQRNPPQQSHLKPQLNAKQNLKINSSQSRQPGTARQRLLVPRSIVASLAAATSQPLQPSPQVCLVTGNACPSHAFV